VATAQAFQARDLQQLEVAMATLMSPGWLAPQPGDGDLSAWVGTLREVFLTADLPTRVRIDVVKVLSLADAAGNRLPQVFQLLREEVARPTLAAEVRSAVLFGLQELIPSAGEAREIAAEQYLDLLEGLQTDKDVKLRLDAARLLDVPDNLSAKKSVALGQRLVEVVGERLLVETDDQVFSAQVMALRNLTAKDQDAHVGAVNSRLRTALDVLRARPATDRLGTLISGLETVALNERRTAAEWFETCRRLLDVPQVGRKSIRGILEFHIGRNPARLQSESKELQAEVHKLVIRTAVLRPDSDPWRSDKTGAEARMVQRAFKSLLASGEFEKGKAGKKDAIDSPRTRLTCLRALASLATPADAAVLEQQVSKWLEAGDQVLQGPDRDAARLLYAESLLQQGRPEDAWQKSGLQAVNGPNLDERLRVTDELAAAMIKRRPDEAAALPLLADVVQKTPPTSEAYWPRFCRWLELRHTVDPKTGAALLKELDAWIATRGKLNGTVKDQADRLRAALAGDAVPGK
jgi:hypothetical protein